MFNQNLSFTGLVTTVVSIPDTVNGVNVDVKCQIPTLTNGGGVSGLVITVKHNTSTVYTGTAGALGAWTNVSGVTAGDTISVITSSSNAVDAGINAIQGNIAISEGVQGY